MTHKETKAQRVARKQRESIALELEEKRKIGRLGGGSAFRTAHNRPANRQAAKVLSHK